MNTVWYLLYVQSKNKQAKEKKVIDTENRGGEVGEMGKIVK